MWNNRIGVQLAIEKELKIFSIRPHAQHLRWYLPNFKNCNDFSERCFWVRIGDQNRERSISDQLNVVIVVVAAIVAAFLRSRPIIRLYENRIRRSFWTCILETHAQFCAHQNANTTMIHSFDYSFPSIHGGLQLLSGSFRNGIVIAITTAHQHVGRTLLIDSKF